MGKKKGKDKTVLINQSEFNSSCFIHLPQTVAKLIKTYQCTNSMFEMQYISVYPLYLSIELFFRACVPYL